MDKIFKTNKKIKYCMIIITLMGILAGSLFITILKDTDKETITNSLNSFFDNIINNNLNYSLSLKSGLITNIIFVLSIWIFAVSIIGIPVILFLYFIKVFGIGLTISSIIFNYKAKGIIYALIYIFPHNILLIFILAILSINSIIYSFKVSNSFFKKESIDFRPILNKHKYILLVSIITILITSLYNTYIMPYLLKMVLKFIK
jgi:stage II sporulation protein M